MNDLIDICYSLEHEWSDCELCGSYPSELVLQEYEDDWELRISYGCYGGMNMFGSNYSGNDVEEIIKDAQRFELWNKEKESVIINYINLLRSKYGTFN